MNRKVVIAIIIVFSILIISVASYFIYKSVNKNSKKTQKEIDDLKAQLEALTSQANSPSTTIEEKQSIFSKISDISKSLKDAGIDVKAMISKYGNKGNVEVVNPNVQQPSGFPLKKGSRSENVKNLQKSLNSKCNAGLVADGVFGSLTENALERCYGMKQADFSLYNTVIS